MSLFGCTFLLALSLISPVNARPTETTSLPTSVRRQADLSSLFASTINSIDSGLLLIDAGYDSLAQELQDINPTSTPTTVEDALSTVENILDAAPTDVQSQLTAIAELIQAGFDPQNSLDFLNAADNDANNVNLEQPSTPIYPRAQPGDAPYYQSESTLRSWIHIPSTFTFGQRTDPVILVPGTGARGGMNFASNLRQSLANQPFWDPIWLNPSGYMLDDAQTNAEMVAYAIHYISGISGNKNVSLVTWSQGGIAAQWAIKYWPSARGKVSQVIATSPDYKGTVEAPLLCFPGSICPPSVIQQEDTSDFIAALRAEGGDSAYVPTTTIYSSFFDEIVEPQQGTGASAYLLSSAEAAATNLDIQDVCEGELNGDLFVTHEGVLFHPLAPAVVEDALTNGGPADVSRLDTASLCQSLVAEGLGLDSVLGTEALIPFAGLQIVLYPNKIQSEPPVRSYATT